MRRPIETRKTENYPVCSRVQGYLIKRSRLCEKSKSWIADPATPKGKHDDGPVAAQITRGCQPFRWREVVL